MCIRDRVKNDEAVSGVMKRLRDAGMRIAMDDFGTGYSSLNSLRHIPADIVKIDRSFVRGITEDAFNATLIRSVTQLCHNVGKRVCLEGVETGEEYRAVREMGIELIQGYYFGRPMPPEEFERKLLEPEV